MKLPFEFSLKLVFRIVLPGFVLSLGLYPLIAKALATLSVDASPEIVLTLSALTLGWLFVALDMPIYMVFEGRRYWPGWLWRLLRALEKRRLKHLERVAESAKKSDPRKYREASVELRRFPIDRESEERRAECPTRLGNLIMAYEGYSNLVYGMDAVFYWPRIWVVLDKDLREEIDNQQALADSATYVAAALVACGVLALLYAGVGLLPNTQLEWMPYPRAAGLLSAAGIGSAWVFYRLSLHAHAQFGELFKAVFDMYRCKISVDDVVREVAEIAGQPSLAQLPAKDQFEIAWRYLHNYRIKIPSGVVRPKEARERALAALVASSPQAMRIAPGTHGAGGGEGE